MRHVKLVECAKILYGYPFDSSLFTEDDSYIPLIRIRDVMPGVASTYYTGEILSDYLIKAEDILVGMDGNFNLAKWKDRDGLLNQRTLKISAKDDLCINGYLYHLLGPIFKQIELNTAGGSVKHLSAKTINSIEIPLPPLPIQQEIVRILDSFTSLITNLETELASRQKQYEHYRNKLLTFDENDESIEWKTLGEVCDVSRGKRVVRKDLAEYGTIPVYQNSLKPLGYAEKSNYPANTPFVISAGAAGEVGYSFTEYWGADDCFSVLCNEGVNSRFTYHWLKIKEGFLQSRIRGGAIKRLSRDYVDDLLIPIPSLQRQQEIVSTIDTFESLITNIKQELEARKKQYEYYREQLLTFRPSPALP